MGKKVALYSALGFTIGAVVGFLWSQGAKSSLSDNITTSFSGGKLAVQIDLGATAGAGLKNIL